MLFQVLVFLWLISIIASMIGNALVGDYLRSLEMKTQIGKRLALAMFGNSLYDLAILIALLFYRPSASTATVSVTIRIVAQIIRAATLIPIVRNRNQQRKLDAK